MAKTKNDSTFTPTFRKYADMNGGEQAAFRQGAYMVENGVKERLGLKKPREQKSVTHPAPLQNSAAPKDGFYGRYLKIKAQNRGAVLFVRVGDFYEVMGDDARVASAVLDLVLTTRSAGTDRVPMCGVPHHTLERYAQKLVQRGYKVAVAESL